MIDAETVKQALPKAFTKHNSSWRVSDYNDSIHVELNDYEEFSFSLKELLKLGDILGTDKIDVRNVSATPAYSEYTPGDPAAFMLIIHKG